MDCLDYNLFVNILTSLKSNSDLKWTFKTLNTGQFALNSQGTHLSNYEKQKILEQNIKLTILKVCNIINYLLLIWFYYNIFSVSINLFYHSN